MGSLLQSQFGLGLQFTFELVSPVGGRKPEVGVEQLPPVVGVVSGDARMLVASCVHF